MRTRNLFFGARVAYCDTGGKSVCVAVWLYQSLSVGVYVRARASKLMRALLWMRACVRLFWAHTLMRGFVCVRACMHVCAHTHVRTSSCVCVCVRVCVCVCERERERGREMTT
jgi:hypothetical protein